jgi:mRNA interferase MazF
VTYNPFDVVVVPFPFTDRAATRRRPALVLSHARALGEKPGRFVLAMITSADNLAWPLDVPVKRQAAAGLPSRSVIRMKLFTLDHGLILRKVGRLGRGDQQQVRESLRALLPV